MTSRRIEIGILVVVAVTALPHALYGPGYVLDDWWALANGQLDGALAAAGDDQWLARPGAGITYALMFGVLGHSPALAYAVLVALSGLTTVSMFRVGRHVWPPVVAGAVAAVWVIIPNHTSLAYWPSAVNIALALLLVMAGFLVVLRIVPRRPAWQAGVLFGLAVVCYEAVAPAALVGAWWLARRTGRRTGWRDVAGVVGPITAAVAWVVVFWHPAKGGIDETADLALAIPAHFGWGVVPGGWPSYATTIVAAATLTVVAARALDPRRRRHLLHGEHLALSGLAAIAVGTAPFVRYFYEPLGAGDRVNVVAAVGTAMVWVGIGWLGHDLLPRSLMTVLATAACVAFAGSQVAAARSWSTAGDVARDEVARIERSACGSDPVVVRRGPTVRNVTAFLDQSNVTGAVAMACGRRVADVRLVRRPGGAAWLFYAGDDGRP
jgi:hypothetical protein